MRVATIVLLLFMCADRGRPQTGAARWTRIRDGVEYRLHDRELHLVRVDPRRAEIDAVIRPNTSARVAAGKGTFAINANFFDQRFRPLGVVVANGKELNPRHDVSWQAVFFVDEDGRADIVPVSAWKKRKVRTAVQCGPRLIVNGKRNPVKKAQPDWRSGVCIDRRDKVIFFATTPDAQLDVHQMVNRAAALGCRDAMLFDGGPSTQMYLRRQGGDVQVSGDKRVPAYVVVR